VLDQVADPMLHLVRNAIDHGIELPEARLAAGKPRYGTVRVHAAQLGSEVVVTVADDGQGIDLARVRQQAGNAGDALDGVGDDEAIYAIFRSGLSTAATVSEVSGRGVGLDVVRASLASVRGRAASSGSASPSPWPSCPACWSRRPAGTSASPCTRW
jgi:two-component system chemotaxis sensor kinase CheA